MTPIRRIVYTLVACLAVAPAALAAQNSFCSQTARVLFGACKASVNDDARIAKAICINVADATARQACLADMKSERDDASETCREQRAWRLEACGLLGEARYAPDFSPSLFDDPLNPSKPNPYFPLGVGDHWEFHAGDEVDVVDVVNETKLIAGVRCIVARDIVTTKGDVTESTDDWYCPAKSGAVWYFGEKTGEYESFDGDQPREPELVDIDGSFKAGRDGDKPGIIFLASPKVGDVYVEEFSLGNAEDVTEILSTTYGFGSDPDLDQGVPQALATLLCNGDCVVTRNFSLLEPGVSARKYYSPGIGVFLEVDPEEPTALQLVSCNVDPRCASLPTP